VPLPENLVMTKKTRSNTRVLVILASHGTRNDQYLAQVVKEYQSMSFDVDIVVLSNIAKNVAPGVQLIVEDLRGKDPWSLPFSHKRIFADRLNDYDLFIYSEDDTLIQQKNLQAFLDVSAVLPEDELPGFLRYEESLEGKVNYPEVHGHFHWDPASVRSRGPYTMAFFTNEHAACYVITQQQLRRAIKSGGFMVGPHRGKYDLLCTASTDPYTQCGFRKFVCISHLDDFLVHHLPNTYVGTNYGIDDVELRRQIQVLLQMGLNGCHPTSLVVTETKLSRCWYSKDYYEPVMAEVVSYISKEARSVLSIGCGWGATETYLAKKGLRVSAVPLDPVIPGGAEAAGVEIINGDLVSVRQALAERKFDCLLLSNVLHLLPDPIEVLSSFSSFVLDGAVIVVVVPNTARLAATWKAIRNSGTSEDLGSYKRTGVQRVSQRALQRWFCASGISIEKVLDLLRPPAQKVGRLTFGALDRWMADEFVVVARKHPDGSAK
jgi:2-polyprenyl-3-methyl-5-hydroxy-6-metoxy-1,4-benzoquinol methylase